MAESKGERTAVLLRIQAELLTRIDAAKAEAWPDLDRNSYLLRLLEIGLDETVGPEILTLSEWDRHNLESVRSGEVFEAEIDHPEYYQPSDLPDVETKLVFVPDPGGSKQRA